MATNVATTMDTVLQDLRLYWGRAYASVSTTWAIPYTETARLKDVALSLLNKQASYIDQLEGSLRTRVLAGDATYPFSRWAGFAQEVRGAIAQTIGDQSSWSLAGILSSTVTQTAKDVATGAKQVGAAVVDYGPSAVLAVVVGLVAYAVISVTRVVR